MRNKIDLSPNYSKKTRKHKDIKFVIIHYTGMQSEIASIERLKDPKKKVSSHYLINRKGQITIMVKELKAAWHAGKSRWKNFINLNRYSIGIELENKGHEFGYQKFSNVQIKSLIRLCKYLKKKYKIKDDHFLGHSDIAPLRKVDPGEHFPWKKLSKYNLGLWYKEKNQKINFKKSKIRYNFFQNLYKIGYRYFSLKTGTIKKDKKIIKAFQLRFLPKRVTGKLDQKTLKISYYLANSYNILKKS
tara:strand:- start:26 stop:760 length:735 start_codon:yes stop_codon:yes gene_type:complete